VPENAKPRDVQAGWGVFRQSGYNAQLDEINAVLSRAGFGTVSQRTYTHYRKLHRYGYERYIPINVLDVETHQNPVWGVPLRSRYKSRPADTEVNIFVVAAPEVLLSLQATSVGLSDAEIEVLLSVPSTQAAEPFVSQLEGLPVLLTPPAAMGDAPIAATIDLAATNPLTGQMALSLSFASLLARGRLTGTASLPSVRAAVGCGAPNVNEPASLIRNLTALIDALDISRMIADEIVSAIDPGVLLDVGPLRIERVSVASPIIVEVLAATPVLGVFFFYAARTVKLRKGWKEGDVLGGQARVLDAEAEKRRADAHLTEAQAEYVQALTRRREVETENQVRRSEPESNALVGAVLTLLRDSLPQGTEPMAEIGGDATERVNELVEKQGLPAFERLGNLDENEIGFRVEPESKMDEIVNATREFDDGDRPSGTNPKTSAWR
jgi:hypothetical protein